MLGNFSEKNFTKTETKKDGWYEIENREKVENLLREFLKNYFRQTMYSDVKDFGLYDNADIHFSGSGAIDEMKKGEGKIVNLGILYQDGKPEQFHAIFEKNMDNGNKGNTDVYLYKKALEDFCEQIEK